MTDWLTKWTRFFALVATLVTAWIAFVPRIQSSEAYQARQQLLEARQIDPSAMFYTELAGLEAALDRTRHLLRSPGSPPTRAAER